MSTHELALQVARRTLGARVPAFVDDGYNVTSLVYGPELATLSGDAWTYTQQPLQGLKALTFPNSPQSRGLTFTNTLAEGGGGFNWVARAIGVLRTCAARPAKVRIVGASQAEAQGWWFISDLSISYLQRDEHQEPLQATLTWTLIEANLASRVSRIGESPPPADISSETNPVFGTTTKGRAPKTTSSSTQYVVKAGDSLRGLSVALLGKAARWQEIAAANNLPNPNALVIGSVLTIPAR